jgi:adenine-specific DNA-methyltransferase
VEKRVDFYKHDVDWANRLILGDSLLVMNSLLTKELMIGQVQMVYVDPPYGVNYSSNFQPTVTSHEVKEGKDESLTREPEQIKAYRDTWELGIHSYLTYLRDRFLLARELMAETASIFVQISDENLPHVQELMDEVFGHENRCDLIIFRKTGTQSSQLLGSVGDFLLWYAKDKKKVTFHPLFFVQDIPPSDEPYYVNLELIDGTTRRMSPEEQRREVALPKGSRIFRQGPITSPGESKNAQPFDFGEKTYLPGRGRHWTTTIEGMKKLAEQGRILVSGNNIASKLYWDDVPSRLTNIWEDTQSGGFNDPKLYVVQTTPKVIERCILMTTNPGDLVFDPTCGSGTTAFVAEKMGRRWITCLARQRLLTNVYPYYRLAHVDEGLKSGFEYETASHITLGSIAQNEQAEIEVLYDRPKVDKSVVRISGPFTVEGIPAPSTDNVGGQEALEQQNSGDYISALVGAVMKSGFVLADGKKMHLTSIAQTPSAGFIHAEGLAKDEIATRVAISFGPRYGRIGSMQTEEAIRTATANGYALLILAGFDIDPGAQTFVGRTPLKLRVQFAHINPDMKIHDLLKQTHTSQLFTIFGEPDVRVSKGKTVFTRRNSWA